MTVPNQFANVTTSIPLSQLDANFNTPITLGNTAIQLGNTVTTLNNMTLANVTVSSGNVTITNVSVTTANVTTANIATAQIANVTVSGTGTFAAGSNTAPSITTSSDTNTGIFFPAADTVAIGTGSTEALRVNSSQQVGIGTSSPGAKLDVRGSSTFLINATNPTAWVSVDSALTTGSMYNQFNTSSNVGISGTYTNHAYTFVTNNTERMRINAGAPILCLSGGNTSATGTGIAFPATQSASSDANTLDDYEEGTWTPSGATGFPAGGQPSSINATYTKVGNMVSVRAQFVGYNDGTSLLISGLPFSASNDCAASIANSTPNTFSYERISGTGFQCTISGTNATNKTWVLAATYQAA